MDEPGKLPIKLNTPKPNLVNKENMTLINVYEYNISETETN